MKKETDTKIILEIYRRMYHQAEPKAEIDKIMKSGEGKMPSFFSAYYLAQEKEDEIINEVLKKFKIPKRRWSAFYTTVILGSAPSSNKTEVMKERKNYSKKLKKFLSKEL